MDARLGERDLDLRIGTTSVEIVSELYEHHFDECLFGP
jgi:hypothetical protein